MKAILSASISFLLVTPTVAADISQLYGEYVAPGVSCKVLDDYSDDRVMTIRKDHIEFWEQTCAVRQSQRSSTGFSLKVICEAEGETVRGVIEIHPVSKQKVVVDGRAYVRCR
jgi:hypothetical protein